MEFYANTASLTLPNGDSVTIQMSHISKIRTKNDGPFGRDYLIEIRVDGETVKVLYDTVAERNHDYGRLQSEMRTYNNLINSLKKH